MRRSATTVASRFARVPSRVSLSPIGTANVNLLSLLRNGETHAPSVWGSFFGQLRFFSARPYPQDHELSASGKPQNSHESPPKNIFEQNSAANSYREKSWTELVRAYVSLSLCQLPWLVQNAETLLRISNAVLGPRTTEGLMKHTLYGHFCIGQNEQVFLPTLKHMKKIGIGTMLDYAAEGGFVATKHQSAVEGNDAEIEKVCDENTADFCDCLQSASLLGEHGTVAICVTAIGSPLVLQKFTTMLKGWQQLFERESNSNVTMSAETLQSLLAQLYPKNKGQQNHLLERMIDSSSGKTDLIRWTSLVKPEDFLGIQALDHSLDATDVKLLEACHKRGRVLAQKAASTGSPLYVDAEQVRYQHAIDHLVWTLQREYNDELSSDRPVVFGTYQSYLKDATTRLQRDVERAARFQYIFAAKLVRGAYMTSERALAEESGQESPVHDTIEDTHACFNHNVDLLLEHASSHPSTKMEVFLATHNEESILRAMAAMERYGINRQDKTVAFGQLFGMADHLTAALAKHKYRSFKYAPYGSVSVLMPYLIRRAIENNALASGAKHEIRMIGRELSRRMLGF